MEVHIGREIESKFQESGLKIGTFADRINTGERNVYSIFTRKDISAAMLTTISNVLEFNFFSLYETHLKSGIVAEPEARYLKNPKSISINLVLSGDMAAVNEFPELLHEINTSAAKHGFKLI